MALPGVISAIALILYYWALFNVRRARKRFYVEPPATQGAEAFNRIFRTQQVIGEHLIVFIPSLWMFSYYLSEFWGGILGAIWVIGRLIFAIGYYQSTARRLPGVYIAYPVEFVLVLGALIGATQHLAAVGIN